MENDKCKNYLLTYKELLLNNINIIIYLQFGGTLL